MTPVKIQIKSWLYRLLARQYGLDRAGANILPGVTVGVNSIVAAGAIVSKVVPANSIVRGVPARFFRAIEEN